MSEILSLLRFSNDYKLPVILQTEQSECGLACLAMVSTYFGHRLDLATARQEASISLQGITLETMMSIADKLQMSSRPLRLELDSLAELSMPAILHWDLNHFVVLKKANSKKITIHDPAFGIRELSLEEASPHFTGVALELRPTKNFEKKETIQPVKLTQFWERIVGLKRNMIQAFILSLVLQAFALLTPLYSQLVVDEVITKGDKELLTVIAIGFALVMVFETAVGQLRAYVMLYFSNSLSFQMSINLFRHLLRLPLEYFEKRHIGDIVSRFGSMGNINSLLTSGIIGAILDGIMAISTLIMILYYSWKLTIVVIVGLLIGFAIQLITFPIVRRQTEENINLSAKENSIFLESIRGARAVKIFGKEMQRQTIWQNAMADVMNSSIKIAKFGLNLGILVSFLSGAQSIIMMYLGALMVIDGTFSLGMLFAFQAYSGQFAGRVSSLFGMIMNLKMLKLHLERLADIVHTEKEVGIDNMLQSSTPLRGEIELKNISFRYSDHSPYIFENLNLHIQAGEMVTLMGVSGGGKSTLMKIMLGLLQPTSGEVFIDGQSIRSLGVKNFRSQVGVVMQDDQLLSGSILENISFFDNNVDIEKVHECAKRASLYDDIMAMPMQFQSLIGDMGTILSGGQKQRLLIARAYYNNPRILFMDEGTANLDEQTEININKILKSLKITRFMIAHRPEMKKAADRVVFLHDGKLEELPKEEL